MGDCREESAADCVEDVAAEQGCGGVIAQCAQFPIACFDRKKGLTSIIENLKVQKDRFQTGKCPFCFKKCKCISPQQVTVKSNETKTLGRRSSGAKVN